VNKVSRERVQEALSISRCTLWRMLKKQVSIDGFKLRKIFNFLTLSEFKDIPSFRKLLKSLGIVEPSGSVKHAVAMKIISMSLRIPYLGSRS